MDPKLIRLTGRNYRCYNIGVNTGAGEAFKDCASYLQVIQSRIEEIVSKLPEDDATRVALTALLTGGVTQILDRSKMHSVRGEDEISHLHKQQLEEDRFVGKQEMIVRGLAGLLIIGVIAAFIFLR
jgi:hypothetical protein